jgi:hypothetical protein
VRDWAIKQLRRPLAMAVVLLLCYAALALLNNPRGYLGTDTGGKVATLEVMSDKGTLDPDVGYWAEQWDPTGVLHPLYYTKHKGEKWVNATTLPALYAELPLYVVGGYRLALLVPMLGALAAAFGALALARRLGSSRPHLAFWIVGLASPLTIYAVDIWEHAIGVALMLWAAVFLLDVVDGEDRWWKPIAAGALLGGAFTMRTEALVYFAAEVGVVGIVLLHRRRLWRAVGVGAAAAGAALVVVVFNAALELATVGEQLRTTRAQGTASSLGAVDATVPGSRFQDALTTTLNLHPSLDPPTWVLGAVLVVAIITLGVRSRAAQPDDRVVRLVVVAIGTMYLIRFLGGLGFVPGMFATMPFAALGLLYAWSRNRSRIIAVTALVALPAVWVTMYAGGAGPQWGGRYQLTTGVLLLIVGAVGAEADRRVFRTVAVASCLVTLFGAAWMVQRTNAVGGAAAVLDARNEDVLISQEAHLWREVATTYTNHRELTALGQDQLDSAVQIVDDAGLDSFALVRVDDAAHSASPVPGAGWAAGAPESVEFVPGLNILITPYHRAA